MQFKPLGLQEDLEISQPQYIAKLQGPIRPHSFPRDQFRSEWINTTRKS
jgi:hypothetical protein